MIIDTADVVISIPTRADSPRYRADTIRSLTSPADMRCSIKNGNMTANTISGGPSMDGRHSSRRIHTLSAMYAKADRTSMEFLILELTISVMAQIKSVSRYK